MANKLTLSAFSKDAVQAEICKRSFYTFIKEFWHTIIPEQFVDGWHIEFLANEMQMITPCIVNRTPKPYDLVINVPPGTSKSTICTIMYPAWLWAVDDTLRIISNSYSHDLALGHALKSRDVILSDQYQTYYNIELRRDKSGKSNYANGRGGERLTTSTGSAVTGNHGHVIINDDPSNPLQVISAKERKTANDHLGTLNTRTVMPGSTPMITIQQRLHTDDVTGFQLKEYPERIRHICLPAELTNDVKPESVRKFYVDGLLDPVRFNHSVLAEKKQVLGSAGYAGQFLQTPMSDDAAFFKSINNRYFSVDNGCIVTEKNERIFIDTCVRFFTIDLAITTNANSDYTVISYFAADKNNNIYLIDCYREKIEGAQHADIVNMMYQKYKPHAVGVESVAYQQSLCQTLIRMGLPVVMLRPDKSKETRAWSAAIRHENGAIYFNRNLNNLNDLELELGMFPNSKHDDFVDTLSYAVEYMQANDVNVYADIKIDTIKQAYKSRKPNNNLYF